MFELTVSAIFTADGIVGIFFAVVAAAAKIPLEILNGIPFDEEGNIHREYGSIND